MPRDPLAISQLVHQAIGPAIEARLDQLVEATGRSKAFDLRELIEQGIDDLEDSYLGAAVLERICSVAPGIADLGSTWG
jgi:RHH-type rel operon transcriptional repressor/antitoxin RelB